MLNRGRHQSLERDIPVVWYLEAGHRSLRDDVLVVSLHQVLISAQTLLTLTIVVHHECLFCLAVCQESYLSRLRDLVQVRTGSLGEIVLLRPRQGVFEALLSPWDDRPLSSLLKSVNTLDRGHPGPFRPRVFLEIILEGKACGQGLYRLVRH